MSAASISGQFPRHCQAVAAVPTLAQQTRASTSSLAVAGDRTLVFSEARQAIFELSDLAAYVWRSLDSGLGAAAMVSELVATGVEPDQAQAAIELTLQEVQTLRTAATPPPPVPLADPSERLTRRTVEIAGVSVQLHLSIALIVEVEAVFGSLLTDLPDADRVLCARAAGNRIDFFSPGQPDWSCDRAHFIPVLKAQLIEAVLQCARYEVALHAAALARGDDAVLLMGSPGAGKTTLAIALAKAGFDVLADDVVLLKDDGRVTGLPFPFTAKSSSWALLSDHWPGITAQPGQRRPDGQALCYIPHDQLADPRPRRIGSVILLGRQEHCLASIEELDWICALKALVADGATRDERLSASSFTALVEGLRDARCARLTYSDLQEGAEAVGRFHS